jgi:hypothetical protein
MKRLLIRSFLVSIIGLLGVTTVFASPHVYHVSGGGTAEWGNGMASYSFNAHMDATGSVFGEATVHHPAPSFAKRHIKISCMAVADNSVWLGGVSTQSTYSADYEGRGVVWRVIDNGEGRDSFPDEVSSIFSDRDPNWCTEMYAFFPMKPLKGNVQFR